MIIEEPTTHMGQNSKQINMAKYISKFLTYGAKMLDKCVKSQKKKFVHCPFLQSRARRRVQCFVSALKKRQSRF